MAQPSLRIAVTGSAGVGKTAMVVSLASALGLPCIREEMRNYLEATGRRFSELLPAEAAAILWELWQERSRSERAMGGFVADNCSLDFLAYALHYRCITDDAASRLLPEVLERISSYDAVFVLPWGVLPYISDGVRSPDHHEQLGYQLIIEGLVRRYIDRGKVYYVPEPIEDLRSRCNWACAVLGHNVSNCDQRGNGVVYLVGAGPGDPRLLTLRAFELLQRADVVAHDLLVPSSILSLAPGHAEILPVGRRHGAERKDYRLHPDVLDRARKGKAVVRLKCGDPFIFGRGGEEAEELVEAGIPFEIVPGISAALGAAAYAGIPLTHRLHSSRLTFTTGHDAGDKLLKTSAFNEGDDLGTAVLYMVTRRLQANVERLIQAGYAAQTPVAYIAGATTSSQQVIVGTLEDLAEKTEAINKDTPALVIAGRVVELRDKLSWFEKQRLQGYRILLARARAGPSAIAKQLRALGAEIVEAPAISITPLPDRRSLLEMAGRLRDYDAIVFGCAAGVEHAWQGLGLADSSRNVKIVAVGEQARRALCQAGATNVISCSGGCEEAVESIASQLRGLRLLSIASSVGRPYLESQLSAIAKSIHVVHAYQIEYSFAGLRANPNFDLVVAPSSSAASLLMTAEPMTFRDVPFVTMGPLSAAAARALGATAVIQAAHDDIESLISCVITQLADKQRSFAAFAAGHDLPLIEAPHA